MEIILGKTAGFCYGVQNAVQGANKAINSKGRIYCLGEIVHNRTVLKYLKENGIKFVDSVDEVYDNVIIRAHGETEETYQKLKEKNVKILDYTCPNVAKIHKIAKQGRDEGKFIILIGIKGHPESIATLSYAGEKSYLLQEKDQYLELIQTIEKKDINNILIIAQTTYNSKKFDEIVLDLEQQLNGKVIKVEKTICGATEIRQKETAEIAQKVDAMLIIGDKKSSNTNKLNDIAREFCNKVIMIQNEEELKVEDIKSLEKIGVMAGASTPKEDIENVIEKIRKECDGKCLN